MNSTNKTLKLKKSFAVDVSAGSVCSLVYLLQEHEDPHVSVSPDDKTTDNDNSRLLAAELIISLASGVQASKPGISSVPTTSVRVEKVTTEPDQIPLIMSIGSEQSNSDEHHRSLMSSVVTGTGVVAGDYEMAEEYIIENMGDIGHAETETMMGESPADDGKGLEVNTIFAVGSNAVKPVFSSQRTESE